MGPGAGHRQTQQDTTVAYARRPAPESLSEKGALPENFNARAAGEVYRKANTLDLKGMDWTYIGYKPEDITVKDIDVDSTIKGSSVQTNLEAMYAGFKGTQLENEVSTFKNVILKHDDLKTSADALLKDEGSKALQGIQKMLVGDNGLDMAQFEQMMDKPGYRKVVSDMFKAVATDKYGMDDAVEFVSNSMAAIKDPNDKEKRKKFMDQAQAMGVDTSGLQQQYASDSMQNLWGSFLNGDMKGFGQQLNTFLVQAIEGMGLSPEWTNRLVALSSGVTQFYTGILNDYANGYDNQPGFIQIAQSAGYTLNQEGEQIRKSVAPAPTM